MKYGVGLTTPYPIETTKRSKRVRVFLKEIIVIARNVMSNGLIPIALRLTYSKYQQIKLIGLVLQIL